MNLIETSYRTVFRTFYKNQILKISTFLFVRDNCNHFIDCRQIFSTSIYIFFQYKLYLKIEDDVSSVLQLPKSLLYNHIDLNEQIIILKIQSELQKDTTIKPIIIEITDIRNYFGIVEIDLDKLKINSTNQIEKPYKIIQHFLDLKRHRPVSIYATIYHKAFYKCKHKKIVISPKIIPERFNLEILIS